MSETMSIMYKSSPVNTKCVIEHYPTCMYSVKSVYGDFSMPSSQQAASTVINDASLDLVNLSKDSESQLRRLNRLQNKVNQFCEDVSLGHLVANNAQGNSNESVKSQGLPHRVNTRKTKNSTVDDMALEVSPNSMPYSLLAAFGNLATKYKCFMQFFVHGSAVNELKKPELAGTKQKIESMKILFQQLKLDLTDPRNSYDYGISFIWKKTNDENLGPVLTINSKSKVYGEANILRYLTQLVQANSVTEKENDLMDRCTNLLLKKPDQKSFLSGLLKSLTASEFLSGTGKQSGLADLYVWSMLKQSSIRSETGKIFEWMSRVEESCSMLKMVNVL